MKTLLTLSKSSLAVGKTTRIALVMHFGANESIPSQGRRRLNLALVLDRSGSMAGAPLKQAIAAAQAMVNALRADDRISVVTYDDTPETIVPPQLAANKAPILASIGKVKAGGCTNLSGGWLEGCSHVANHASKEQVNRVLLLTDGQANMGIKDPSVLINTARQKAEAGVVTTTLGFGSAFNEDLLIGMARAAEGNFYFVESPEDVAQVFNIELDGLSSVVGQNLVVKLRLGDTVQSARVLNSYRSAQKDKELTIFVGDVYAVEERAVVVELSVCAPSEGTLHLADVSYSYQTVIDAAIQEITGTDEVRAEATGEAAAAAAGMDLGAVSAASRLESARVKDEAVVLADGGDVQSAARKLRVMAEELRSGPLAGHFEFAEEIDLLEHFAERLEKKAYDSGIRKQLRDQSYQAGTRQRSDLAQRGAGGGSSSALPTTTSADGGVVLRCGREGGKLRVHVASPGYDATKNVQFPRANREEGVSYCVESVTLSADGGYYRVEGAIRRLLEPGERVRSTAPSKPAAAKPTKSAKAPATAADLLTTTEVGSGVVVQCVKEGSKLRARVVSDGYDPNWNIRFPRSIRELGVLYVVDEVVEVAGGGQYAATGEIKRLVQ